MILDTSFLLDLKDGDGAAFEKDVENVDDFEALGVDIETY